MTEAIFLFCAKLADNMLSTVKNIMVQRNRAAIAGLLTTITTFIYMYILKDIATSDNLQSMIMVSIASGIGCYVAVKFGVTMFNETYVNVIMSDDIEAMKRLRDFLAKNKITNMANDCYTLEWDTKTISIIAFAKTKQESKLIDEYLVHNDIKFKRMIQK